MESIKNLLVALSPSDARATLYYLSRYLKQAKYYEEYKKDYFEDDYRSYPGEEIRRATLRLKDAIEVQERAPVAAFDESTYFKWAEIIDEIEIALDPETSIEDAERADAFIDSMSDPGVKEIN